MAALRLVLILSLLLLGGYVVRSEEDNKEDPNDTDGENDTDTEEDDPEDLFVDLTHEIAKDIPRYPTVKQFKMDISFKGKSKDGNWYQNEDISTGTHIGTHLDAPCHYARDTWCVSEIPFSCLSERPAVVIDISDKVFLENEVVPETQLSSKDIVEFEEEHGRIPNDSVVLILTGWGKYWPNKAEYLGTPENDPAHHRYPGLSGEAARWLTTERDICGVGIDTISIDYGQSKSPEAHVALSTHNKYILENVAHLEKLPATGAVLNVGVIKIGADASGAPARLMARLPDPEDDDDSDDDDDDVASQITISWTVLSISTILIIWQLSGH